MGLLSDYLEQPLQFLSWMSMSVPWAGQLSPYHLAVGRILLKFLNNIILPLASDVIPLRDTTLSTTTYNELLAVSFICLECTRREKFALGFSRKVRFTFM